jgi:AcrR family transcriptional regulator
VARTLNPESHALRRDEFVDVAQRLIQSKGYEQMSVQDILEALDTSKGAFYHYFESKSRLLEAVIDRMVESGIASVMPIVDDPRLSAAQKLEGVFAGIARFKGERTELLRAVMDTWLADDNAIVREKFRMGIGRRFRPLLAKIVEQGRADGEFTIDRSDDVAAVLVALLLGANEAAVELWFARQAGSIAFEAVEHRHFAFQHAFEQILGLPYGSLHFSDRQTLLQWYG